MDAFRMEIYGFVTSQSVLESQPIGLEPYYRIRPVHLESAVTSVAKSTFLAKYFVFS